MSQIIIGRNAVTEALKNNREIEKITVAKGAEGSVKQIVAKAKDKKIAELEDKVDQLGKILTTLTELAKAAKLSPEREQMKVEAMRSRFQLQGEIKRLNNRVVEIDRVLQQHQNLSISCRKEFYPGVVIRINSFLFNVNTPQPRSRATIGSDGIVFMPL